MYLPSVGHLGVLTVGGLNLEMLPGPLALRRVCDYISPWCVSIVGLLGCNKFNKATIAGVTSKSVVTKVHRVSVLVYRDGSKSRQIVMPLQV